MTAVRAAGVAAVAAALALVGGCTAGQPATPERLVIAAGDPADVYGVIAEALGQAARDAWSAEVGVLATEGPVDNLRLVATGEADVGFTTVDAAAAALSGESPFRFALQIDALARLYDDYLQVVVRADGGIRELADLAGRRVSVGTSGTDTVADRVLTAADVLPSDIEREVLNPRVSAGALAAGDLDAFFVAGGLPTPVVSGLFPSTPIRLLTMPGMVEELQSQYGEYYQPGSIPAETYRGLEAEVVTVTVATVLVVRRDLPAEFAHRLTDLLFDAKPELMAAHPEARRLDHRSALATFPLPLHEGARRYYRGEKPLA